MRSCLSVDALIWHDPQELNWRPCKAPLQHNSSLKYSLMGSFRTTPHSSPAVVLPGGAHTCYQTADGELNTWIFRKSPPASHHHPNKCYCYLQITNSWLHFFSSYLIPYRQRIKRGKTKIRAMWLIKGKNLYLLACKGLHWYTPVKAKSNAIISCHSTEPKTPGNKIWEVNRRTNYYKWSKLSNNISSSSVYLHVNS